MKHGHVTPNADGSKARCGGPAICSVCQQEKAALEAMPSNTATITTKSKAEAIIELLKDATIFVSPYANGCHVIVDVQTGDALIKAGLMTNRGGQDV